MDYFATIEVKQFISYYKPKFNKKVASFFFKEFQLIVFTLDDNFLSLDQDTNQFLL